MLRVAYRSPLSSFVVPALALALAACGGGEPAAAGPATPEPAAPADTAAAAEPNTDTMASAAPSGSASAAPAATGAAKAGPSGRPLIQDSNDTEIKGAYGTTPGARLTLGATDPAGLLIPEGSLGAGYNMVFKIEPKAKGNGASVGKIFRLTVHSAAGTEEVAAQSTGTPFELSLPLGGQKEGNLAWGTVSIDDKGKEKVEWKVIPMTRVDDTTKRAVFELKELSSALIHLTTKK